MKRRALLTLPPAASRPRPSTAAPTCGTDLSLRADHLHRRLAGRRRQRHQHAAARRRARASRSRSRWSCSTSRAPAARSATAKSSNAKPDGYTIGMFSSGGIALAVHERAGQHDRRTAADRLLRRRPERAAGQHRERHRLAQGLRRARPRQSRQDEERQRRSRAARPTSQSRCTRSCSTSRSRACPMPALRRP